MNTPPPLYESCLELGFSACPDCNLRRWEYDRDEVIKRTIDRQAKEHQEQ
jgi:hypothetical protein